MEVLQRPLVTEKVSALNKHDVYSLIVYDRFNKDEIKKVIERFYGVTVERINTMRYAGKRKKRHTKMGVISGKGASYKKVLVKLKSGDVIDFYSNT